MTDYEELDKKALDILVDSLKYVILECRGDGERVSQPQRGRDPARRTCYSPNAKGNFQFDRVIVGCRARAMLDLRRK